LTEFYLQTSKLEVDFWFNVNWKTYKSYEVTGQKLTMPPHPAKKASRLGGNL